LYEMITGRKPYTADTPAAILLKQATEPLPRPSALVSGLPEKVEKLLIKTLARDPKDRYTDMGELARALESGLKLTGSPVERAKPHPASKPTGKMLDTMATVDQEWEVDRTPQPIPASKRKTRTETKTADAQKSKSSSLPWYKTWKIMAGVVVGMVLVVFCSLTLVGYVLSRSAKLVAVNPSKAPATTVPPRTSTVTHTPVPPTFTPTPGIGSTMISEKDGMVMVFVPAGEFTMGSDAGDDDEKPVHQVYLDAFWMDQTEVTNAMYAKCVADDGCAPPSSSKSYTRDSYYDNSEFDDYPVIYVNWNQANAYCTWAGRSLPTEAQWEKAARGTDARAYPWGNTTPNSALLNYNANIGDTSKVRSYESGASPYGAYDMAGNVWEWVADWYDENYYAYSPNRNPQGPSSGEYR
ncbi:MAG TPA: SUMF1/EgtB/PvdO family nonheme iron enzyme, partial [Anaerolineales bacterium]|nr:SUMF1/EgtB/PvdO family nonheme iron enzyme [Anaerolineales bacterium]